MRSFLMGFSIIVIPRVVLAANPVVELARILQNPPPLQSNDPAEIRKEVAFQQQLLKKHADAVTRLADLRSALLLPDWQRNEFDRQGDPLAKVYRVVRSSLGDRLAKALRSRLDAGNDPYRRLAAVTFLAEMAREEYKAENGDIPLPKMPREMGSGWPVIRFTPNMLTDVRKLLSKDKDANVRVAAVDAVVAIAPNETATLDALKPLLAPSKSVGERRAAARGLERMSRVLTEEFPLAGRSGLLRKLGSRLVSAAGSDLSDKDSLVRRLCLETIGQASRIISEGSGVRIFSEQSAVTRQLVGAVNEQSGVTIGLLTDGDLAVRLSAHQVLEYAAAGRRRLRGNGPWKNAMELSTSIQKIPPEDQVLLDGVRSYAAFGSSIFGLVR